MDQFGKSVCFYFVGKKKSRRKSKFPTANLKKQKYPYKNGTKTRPGFSSGFPAQSRVFSALLSAVFLVTHVCDIPAHGVLVCSTRFYKIVQKILFHNSTLL